MLDHVERRTFLVDPARKHASPIAVSTLDVELDEGTGQPLGFPRRGRIARAKPDQRILGTDRLARLQREITDDAVALVEQGDHRHTVGHRRYPGRIDRRRQGFGNDLVVDRGVVCHGVAGGDDQAQRDQREEATGAHALSGVQAL